MMTMNAVVYEKHGETYIWTFRDGDEQQALQAICEAAHQGNLNLDWEDANLIWQRMAEAPDLIEIRDMGAYLGSLGRR